MIPIMSRLSPQHFIKQFNVEVAVMKKVIIYKFVISPTYC